MQSYGTYSFANRCCASGVTEKQRGREVKGTGAGVHTFCFFMRRHNDDFSSMGYHVSLRCCCFLIYSFENLICEVMACLLQSPPRKCFKSGKRPLEF